MVDTASPYENTSKRAFRYTDYLAPRFWPTLLGVGVLRLMAFLPMPFMALIGYLIGTISYLVLFPRRKIALKNIELCFPELSHRERQWINYKHYCFLGQTILTAPINWWASKSRFLNMTTITGREHYDQALAEHRNIILLVPHFMAMEACGLALQSERPMIGMYQYMKNPLLNKLAIDRRQRFCDGGFMFERKAPLRSILRPLNQGHPMQYSPDQDAGRKGIFVPFFEPLASTTPALGKFAQVTNAVVIPVASTYKPWGMGFNVDIHEPIKHFPSGDDAMDASASNEAMAALIRQYPAQYLWIHKRFKTRPLDKDGNPETGFYKS